MIRNFFNKNLAGIILFVFNRPEHTYKTLTALSENYLAKDSEIMVFCDGARDHTEQEKVNEVRSIVESFRGSFKSMHIIFREKNYGLAKSIIEGVTFGTDIFDKCIIVEDDIYTSKYFLKYMNYGLEKYKNYPNVASIMAYTYPHDETKLKDTFFVNGADCWGWATWKSKWAMFEKDGKKLLEQLRESNKLKLLDFEGTYPYSEMLQHQIDGKNDSWAIRWKSSAILNNLVSLYPNTAFARNIGHDGTGRHSTITNSFDVRLADKMPKDFPKTSDVDKEAYEMFKNFFRSL